MSIAIYTYHDPYKLKEKKELWDEISTAPYFCVSQTLINGLKTVYKNAFASNRVATVQSLIDSVYEDWNSTSCTVKQHAAIDNTVSFNINGVNLSEKELINLKKAFLFNREEVFNSLRTMFELRMNPDNILEKYLTPEQKYILAIYKAIIASERAELFELKDDFTEAEIDKAIIHAIENKKENISVEFKAEDMDRIVIHGVHQFTPILLRTIEEISKYKKVILLFNYQEQYKRIFQTWIDIYSAFDCKIEDFKTSEFHPADATTVSYEGNVLADNMGKLLEGKKNAINIVKPYEILEFDNMTEFASYVAKNYEAAVAECQDFPMKVMKEQVYSADSSVNDILKVYFPEQFGERQFLNYPFGHFFLAIANMWNPETNTTCIKDINDIRECLSAGVIKEESPGYLVSIFGKIEVMFEGCTSIDEMAARVNEVIRKRRFLTDERKRESTSHISYYSVPLDELKDLKKALEELNELLPLFYEDFGKNSNSFQSFYKKLKQYIKEEILDSRELDEEFEDIITRVLKRLEEVENIGVSASFECLKATMSIYLKQETKPGKSANWIVRDFEQIDGDVLRTADNGEDRILHFACLTDDDMSSFKTRTFPWPLTDDFFEVAQNPVDWKYQVYVRARKEYKNFKRYALVSGLEFNRGKYKLSFVKKDGEKEREPYYLLKILGINSNRYMDTRTSEKNPSVQDINIAEGKDIKYSIYDYYRYNICKRKFLLETLAEDNTVFKDDFLLAKYYEIWLENEVREKMQGMPCSEFLIVETINKTYEELKVYFPFALAMNKIDIINNVKGRLLASKSFPVLTEKDRVSMIVKEMFIFKSLKDPNKYNIDVLKGIFNEISQDKIDELLNRETLSGQRFYDNSDIRCKYCSNREICVAYQYNS